MAREAAMQACVPRRDEGLLPLPVSALGSILADPTDVTYSVRAGPHWSL